MCVCGRVCLCRMACYFHPVIEPIHLPSRQGSCDLSCFAPFGNPMVRVTLHIPTIWVLHFLVRPLLCAGTIWLCSKSIAWALVPFVILLIPVILVALAVAWPVGLFMTCLFSPLIVWKGFEWFRHNGHAIAEQERTRPASHHTIQSLDLLQVCVLSRTAAATPRRPSPLLSRLGAKHVDARGEAHQGALAP